MNSVRLYPYIISVSTVVVGLGRECALRSEFRSPHEKADFAEIVIGRGVPPGCQDQVSLRVTASPFLILTPVSPETKLVRGVLASHDSGVIGFESRWKLVVFGTIFPH